MHGQSGGGRYWRLPIATLDVRPDGSIRVEISTGTANTAVNVFEEWADRL